MPDIKSMEPQQLIKLITKICDDYIIAKGYARSMDDYRGHGVEDDFKSFIMGYLVDVLDEEK